MAITVKVKAKPLTAMQRQKANTVGGKATTVALSLYHNTGHSNVHNASDVRNLRALLRKTQTELILLMTELETAIPEEDA